jgi:hypothetical protein
VPVFVPAARNSPPAPVRPFPTSNANSALSECRGRLPTKNGDELLIRIPTYRDWLMNRMSNKKKRKL